MASKSKKRRIGSKPRRPQLTIEVLERRDLFSITPPMLSSPGQIDPATSGADADSMDGSELASGQAAPGLVAGWGFEESTGTTVRDSSGNNNNGALANATWTTAGRFGNALSFNGTSSYVTVADSNSLDLTTAMTLEAWVFPTQANGTWRSLLSKETSYGLAYVLYSDGSHGAGRPALYINDTVGVFATQALPLNTWSHVAGTYDGQALRVYVNGVEVAAQQTNIGLWVSDQPLRIGGNVVYGEYFAGRIDNARVYNRSLTAGEIQTEMNSAVDPPPVSHRWAPLVYAGADFTAASPDDAFLNGEVIANRPQGLTISWSKVSGPGSVTFANPSEPTTTADFSAPGVYELQLTATNNWGTTTDRVVVTIPSDNDEEVLATNNPLVLNEGTTGTITSARLRTTDVDNTPAQLIYTITTGPTRGTVRLNGTATTTFTQADIDASRVTYRHNGSETTSDSFVFRVNDAEGPGTTATFTINVTPVNDEQALSINNPLTLAAGASASITSAVLSTTDADNTPAQLTYTITSSPTSGTLRRSGSATTSFTQADINAGLISYQHNGGAATSDSFAFTVNDGQGTSTTGTFSITVQQSSAVLPEPPRFFVDTTYDASYNRAADIFVAAGGNLQAALDAAQPGQIVELQAGATWTGSFTLRNKVGNGWIYIRSSRYQELPPLGERVGPQHAHLMPKIVNQYQFEPALKTEAGAHHYRLIGIDFGSGAQDVGYVVKLGPVDNETSVNQLAHHITFDRVYIHGHANYSSKAGISANGRHIAIIDSHISEIHAVGQDSQAILVWNGDGPYAIENNHLEAAGENVMFGGVDPAIDGLTPSDIVLRGNYFFKPLSWKNAIPSGPHAGSKWTVKNLFEIKHGQRMLFEGNTFQNNWIAQQNGYALVFTPINQSGDAPQSKMRDITFRNNIVRDVEHFMLLSGGHNEFFTESTERILIENNLIYGVNGRMMVVSTPSNRPPISGLTIRHNTMVHEGTGNLFLYTGDNVTVADNFTFVDNIVTHGLYGYHYPFGTIDTWLTNWEYENNVIIGGNRNIPAGNAIVDNIDGVGFRNAKASDFRLGANSRFRRAASDGSEVGIHNVGVVKESSANRRPGRSGADQPHETQP
jgi:hypothetical protein